MSFRNYNNNENKGPSNTTYSGVTFSNPTPESNVMGSRFSIWYLNKLMVISIAKVKDAPKGKNEYATYDNDNKVNIYLSNTKAKVLADAITAMMADNSEWNNVCVETNTGMIKVAKTPKNYLISISTVDNTGAIIESFYETKSATYNFAVNYDDGNFESHTANNIEINTFVMALYEYYKASSYAIAASVMEASMYKRQYQSDLIRAIADKVGVPNNFNGNTSGGGYSNKSSFGINNRNNSSSNSDDFSKNMNAPAGYETSTFDDIVNNME